MIEQPRENDGHHRLETHAASEADLDHLSSLASFLPARTLAAWRTLAPVVPPVAYLSGGTALTAHLQHRVSRDLDFFTENQFDVRALSEALNTVGTFAPTLAEEGTLNGIFEDTKVQFLDASSQQLLEPTTQFGGVRLASLADVLATKLKVIQDRGALRDYFDLMVLDEYISIEEGLNLLVQKYRPVAAAGVIANVVRGLGFLDDVEDDPSLPLPRKDIETFWARRQPEVVKTIAL
ncbi:nucleotidyl transferase AbiEii/AbiGii toxin family protein [Herbiconiux ginsengi]|uniref:Nucleotidyl transferase AbiEii toxin, Type IV TA system n=1 Tax=Herbiconiux ginsengi TaxID=381665 RepID=A0A1H3PMR2_9MICO|nr:nucleotidyl transferase AbiEii/AbiGii toxin family protein [Herbiconiux ginsengi]SDZ02337.1 Nucleotidyl transferase AbiEii toxin, Type IV TA system [Herbiconiux ginsengi]